MYSSYKTKIPLTISYMPKSQINLTLNREAYDVCFENGSGGMLLGYDTDCPKAQSTLNKLKIGHYEVQWIRFAKYGLDKETVIFRLSEWASIIVAGTLGGVVIGAAGGPIGITGGAITGTVSGAVGGTVEILVEASFHRLLYIYRNKLAEKIVIPEKADFADPLNLSSLEWKACLKFLKCSAHNMFLRFTYWNSVMINDRNHYINRYLEVKSKKFVHERQDSKYLFRRNVHAFRFMHAFDKSNENKVCHFLNHHIHPIFHNINQLFSEIQKKLVFKFTGVHIAGVHIDDSHEHRISKAKEHVSRSLREKLKLSDSNSIKQADALLSPYFKEDDVCYKKSSSHSCAKSPKKEPANIGNQVKTKFKATMSKIRAIRRGVVAADFSSEAGGIMGDQSEGVIGVIGDHFGFETPAEIPLASFITISIKLAGDLLSEKVSPKVLRLITVTTTVVPIGQLMVGASFYGARFFCDIGVLLSGMVPFNPFNLIFGLLIAKIEAKVKTRNIKQRLDKIDSIMKLVSLQDSKNHTTFVLCHARVSASGEPLVFHPMSLTEDEKKFLSDPQTHMVFQIMYEILAEQLEDLHKKSKLEENKSQSYHSAIKEFIDNHEKLAPMLKCVYYVSCYIHYIEIEKKITQEISEQELVKLML